MKLSRSLLCLDCDEVHEDQRKCPSCGSSAPSLLLARVLSPRGWPVEIADGEAAADEAVLPMRRAR